MQPIDLFLIKNQFLTWKYKDSSVNYTLPAAMGFLEWLRISDMAMIWNTIFNIADPCSPSWIYRLYGHMVCDQNRGPGREHSKDRNRRDTFAHWLPFCFLKITYIFEFLLWKTLNIDTRVEQYLNTHESINQHYLSGIFCLSHCIHHLFLKKFYYFILFLFLL